MSVKPIDNWVKINTDGSVKENSWDCGGIIRDSKGNLIMVYATPLAQCSIIFAELAAILYGLKMCLTLGLRNIWIEVDAIYMLFCLRDTGNACADWFANQGCLLNGFTVYTYNSLPVNIKGLIRLFWIFCGVLWWADLGKPHCLYPSCYEVFCCLEAAFGYVWVFWIAGTAGLGRWLDFLVGFSKVLVLSMWWCMWFWFWHPILPVALFPSDEGKIERHLVSWGSDGLMDLLMGWTYCNLGGWVVMLRWMLISESGLFWPVLVDFWFVSRGLVTPGLVFFWASSAQFYEYCCDNLYLWVGAEFGLPDYCWLAIASTWSLRFFCYFFLSCYIFFVNFCCFLFQLDLSLIFLLDLVDILLLKPAGFFSQQDASDSGFLHGGFDLKEIQLIGLLFLASQNFRLVWLLWTFAMELQNIPMTVQLGQGARIQLANAIIKTGNTGATIQFGTVDLPAITARIAGVSPHTTNSEKHAKRPRPTEAPIHRVYLPSP
ncbi:hypothetical protein M5K25_001043 [Dendrobium thyrsiflorum]|uniref:RNase H type-1 domain-containing protein n=1 Tax=Dendrobium thyrsiflorum TaxID=117978 RepID=A0ABD0VVG5_DENTH